ncbi:MAG: hypothetical protein ACPGU1_21440 [Myxococcota bacterium]
MKPVGHHSALSVLLLTLLAACGGEAATATNCPDGQLLVGESCVSLEGDDTDASTSTPGTQSDTDDGRVPNAVELPWAIDSHWTASGYIGDGETPGNVAPKDCTTRAPSAVGDCHGFTYSGGAIGWAGVLWQYPANNWGELPGKAIPSGATFLNVVAWVESGTHSVTFQTGSDLDAFTVSTKVTLTTAPTRVWLDLRESTVTEAVIAFGWTADAAEADGVTLYVDDIRLESAPWALQGAGCEDLPCLNGGACVDAPEGLSCDCSDTAFDGELCEAPPSVTFSVDMSCAGIEAFDAVYVYGDFNDWCLDCLPLMEVAGTDIWQATRAFFTPETLEYKYIVDKGAAEEDLVDDAWAGGACAPVTDYETHANRVVTSPERGTLTTEDIFGRCLPCGDTLCSPSCANEAPCGDNGCGVSCGTCDEGLTCTLGQCAVACEPTCAAESACGDDGCGGSCGSCDGNAVCTEGVCVCTPNCDDLVCGDDGCGGSCGDCAEGQFCNSGICGDVCVPQCADTLACGDDGCEGSCGVCTDDLVCESGQCVPPCEPTCTEESQCGEDGCGGSCGVCSEETVCQGDQCIVPCQPSCADEAPCGDDGCGNSCGSCGDDQLCEGGQCVAAPEMFDVTFAVDMACSGLDSFTTVYVVGPWESWSSDGHPLSDEDGDGVWTATYAFEPGAQVEYKYQVDGWAAEEQLVDDMLTGFSCAPVTNYSSYANRKITVDGDMSLSDTFASCKGCAEPMPSGVTFNVDMSCAGIEDFGFVAVTGPFSSWCPNCNQLSDPDGDNIYSFTFLFDPGTVLEYKYQTDGFTAQEDLIDDMVSGALCAPVTDYDSYANREVTVPEGVPVVVNDTFGTCGICD